MIHMFLQNIWQNELRQFDAHWWISCWHDCCYHWTDNLKSISGWRSIIFSISVNALSRSPLGLNITVMCTVARLCNSLFMIDRIFPSNQCFLIMSMTGLNQEFTWCSMHPSRLDGFQFKSLSYASWLAADWIAGRKDVFLFVFQSKTDSMLNPSHLAINTYTRDYYPLALFSCCGVGGRVPASCSHPRIGSYHHEKESHGPHQ